MLRLLKTPEKEVGRVKWSDNYKRVLKKHSLEEFGNLSAFLKQTQLVLEAKAVMQVQSSRKPSLALNDS